MIERIKGFGYRFGWGVVIAGAPYVNGLALITAMLLCFLLYVFFSLFGICPGPPSETGNPIGWMLYVLFMAVVGWYYWSVLTNSLLILLGAAWSLADLIYAQKNKSEDRYRGAAAGLCLTVIPIAFWFRRSGRETESLLHLAPAVPASLPDALQRLVGR